MEIGIDTQINKIKLYLWLLYPVLSAIILFVSLNFLVGNSDKLVDKRRQENVQLKSRLETKLGILTSANDEMLTEKLKSLAESMPLEKEIWVVMSGLRSQGNLISFRNSGNRSIIVEYGVEDSVALQSLLERIDELKPLMSVSGVSFVPKRASLEIIVANLAK